MADYLSPTPCKVSQPMADTKVHMKKCLEFENNAIGHATFAGGQQCWLG